MARNPKPTKKKGPDRRPRPAGAGGGRPRRGRPKVCLFCREHTVWVDYKDVGLLKRFVNDRGRIKARGATGNCAQHQRSVAIAIKTARELALLPYTVRSAASESPGRRGGHAPTSPAAASGGSAAAAEAATDDEEDGVVVDGSADLPVLSPDISELDVGGDL